MATNPSSGAHRWFRQLWAIRDTIIIVATPLLLLPILFVFPEPRPAGCAYTILIMIVYWMTEVLPMAVTALIPVVLFPWLGVMDSKQVCTNYLKDANMLFFGGLLVAIAVEKWNLHKRVALKVLLLVGSKPIWILFGFMAVTAFLSMWLNNTATTAMMMPIASAVLNELDNDRKRQLQEHDPPAAPENIALQPLNQPNDGAHPPNNNDQPNPPEDNGVHPKEIEFREGSANNDSRMERDSVLEAEPLQGRGMKVDRAASDRRFMQFRKALKLSVPYASSIGGTGTLIGCGPNIVLKGQIEAIYKVDTGINFTSWLVIGFPAMVVDLFGAWFILMLMFIGPKETFASCGKQKKGSGGGEGGSANQVIRTEYNNLGSISFAEIVVMINFIVLAILWFMREPAFIPGWGSLMSHKFVTDACLAITISVLLFIFPSRLPNYLCFRSRSPSRAAPPAPAPPILDWPTVNKQMPWSVILLLGGGFALADACKVSGLSGVIGTYLGTFRDLEPWVIVMLMCFMATVMTSFTSNMATTTIFIPIMAELSTETHINPIYLMLPVTLSASWAYVLPVSTPPNAIAYVTGDLVITDMIKAGLAMCALCLTVLLISINTYGYAFFKLGVYPAWAPERLGLANSTLLTNSTLASELWNTTSTLAPFDAITSLL